jgi:PAS domain S-box-containing protein
MTDKTPDSAPTLRQRAEDKLTAESPAHPKALSLDETNRLVHELQVHQIELEMQNEELRRSQEELDASRALYFNLYDLAPIGYCTLSGNGLIQVANLTLCTLFGVGRSTLTSQRISRFILKEDQALFYLQRKQLLATREPQACELQMVKVDGTVFWARLAMTAAQAPQAPPVCHLMISDITTGKQAEAKLRESEGFFRTLASLAPIGIYLTKPDGHCQYANERWCEMAGLSQKDAQGMGWLQGIHPDDRDHVQATWKHMVDSKGHWGQEYRFRTADGKVTWVYGVATPQLDASGNLVGYIGVNSDITERKQTEETQTFLVQSSTGPKTEAFFHSLARHLAQNLQMDFVCIDHLEGDGLTARTLAVWCDDQFQDNLSYALKDTPCGDVVGKHVCCFPASVCQHFPRDQVLQELRAESYAGVTLWSHEGKPIGLIAVIGRRPLANRKQTEATLKLVATRSAGELERLLAEEALKQKYTEIERFNLLTVDREVRMIELKKETNALLKAAGQPEKYRIVNE